MFQFPITALREIRILQLLNNENVVDLIEICRTKGIKKFINIDSCLWRTFEVLKQNLP